MIFVINEVVGDFILHRAEFGKEVLALIVNVIGHNISCVVADNSPFWYAGNGSKPYAGVVGR